MKIGPMIQNPGSVLRYIFMMGLLSQVMDNAIVNMVNVNAVKEKDSAILTGGKTQSVSSQVMEVNMVNEVNPGQACRTRWWTTSTWTW
jgi:Na+/H+ antiporter NhaD/arsenite permease-like protein